MYEEVVQTLKDSGEVTPDSQNIGEVMEVIPINYKTMLKNLNRFEDWVNSKRGKQMYDDWWNSRLLENLTDGTQLYGKMTAKEYLKSQIDKGVTEFLAQTSEEAGVKSWLGKSPDTLTENGTKPLELAGVNVGQMGIFEWVALTLHSDPKTLSPRDWSWLIANRLEKSDPKVPDGYWRGDQVGSDLAWADFDIANARPRLAVIDCNLVLDPSSAAPFSLDEEQAISLLKERGYKVTKEF